MRLILLPEMVPQVFVYAQDVEEIMIPEDVLEQLRGGSRKEETGPVIDTAPGDVEQQADQVAAADAETTGPEVDQEKNNGPAAGIGGPPVGDGGAVLLATATGETATESGGELEAAVEDLCGAGMGAESPKLGVKSSAASSDQGPGHPTKAPALSPEQMIAKFVGMGTG